MDSKNILKEALMLPVEQRITVIQGLVESLDVPYTEIAAVWAEEAERRLTAYREGRLDTVEMEKVFEGP